MRGVRESLYYLNPCQRLNGYLSNFAAREFKLDGQVYNCVEQRYQSERARFCGRMDLYRRIMEIQLGRRGIGSQLRMLKLGREALEDRV